MTEKVLLAVGDPNLSDILQKHFMSEDAFSLVNQEVFHIAYVEEIVEAQVPDLIIFHETYLESSFSKMEDRENEWITLIKKLRFIYEDQIRMVFLCERAQGDPFLSKLVSVNVLDIFNSRYIDAHDMMEQLKDKPRFFRVAKLLGDDVAFTLNEEEEGETPTPVKEESIPKKEKVIVQKVIEKKVVNKQVIKKQYQLNIQNQVSKIIGVNIERKLIIVKSPFSRVGCTFFAHQLAKQIHDKGIGVSYIENPFRSSYTFDRFNGQHQAAPDYVSLFSAHVHATEDFPQHEHILTYFDSKTSTEPTYMWEQEGVRLIATHPNKEKTYEEKDIDLMMFTKILLSLQKTPYVIIDIGCDEDREVYKELSQMADFTFTILGLDIPNLEQYFSNQKLSPKNIAIENAKQFIVGNQFTSTIAKDVLEVGSFIIPQFPADEIYQAQYKGSFLFQNRDLNRKMNHAFSPIMEHILPTEFVKQKKIENKWKNRWFNKKFDITELKGGETI